ncbi:MAG: DNA polymerase III subunit alpha, partial [Bdellovibrionales bacterium]|nr:DNA polymerase III subunit alpha [Bdellovibrionales bacterium]
WQEVVPFIKEVSQLEKIPIVAANDVHYTEPSDQIAQEVLICIGSNKTLQDESRFRLGSDQFYFKSSEQMRALFQDIPEACDNTLEIAERCDLHFNLKDQQGNPIYHLPTYPTQGGVSLENEMRRLSFSGLEERFVEAKARGESITTEIIPEYEKRLDYELKVIHQMGFNGYFLIVQDFIKWAKQHDIPVGPGRGSGAGSLVAYCLSITDLDPMPYNLIFERFLNPERVSMPDFDIDFCQENRGRVIDYVTTKYGEESVSQIITYGKLQCRAAIRDVGRVMGMTYGEVDVVAKLVPEKLGITIQEAIDTEPRIRELMEADPKVQTLMDLALKIEGLVRHAGIHAAGVIIADGSIVKHAPLYRGAEDENVVQYDMKHAEKIGLIKFDFLGLKTLTHIHEAMRLIQLNRQKVITLKDISLKDKGIYEIMCAGDTAGIFQFEGEGITDLIRKAQPDCFEDIVAINALYRPGPMDMIPDYLGRKKGQKKVVYIFPELEPIVKETYGIIVYQEQVQLIAAKIANYSLGEADMLRRAMGKKIPEVM